MRRVGAICAVLILAACSSSLSQGAKEERAYLACQKAADDQLTAPTTAKWPAISKAGDAIVQLINNDARAVIVAHVDSQNSFGVPIRLNVTCTFNTKDDGKTWTGKALVLDI